MAHLVRSLLLFLLLKLTLGSLALLGPTPPGLGFDGGIFQSFPFPLFFYFLTDVKLEGDQDSEQPVSSTTTAIL